MPQINYYLSNASDFIRDALRLISENSRESRIRENFTSYLRLMFPQGTKWIDRHVNQGETPVKLKRNRISVSGFIDNCIDSTIIEYEKNLSVKSVFDEGLRQVREYCASYANNGVSTDMVTGVLSDTLNWYIYKIDPNSITPGNYSVDNISLRLIDQLHLTDSSIDSAERLLAFLSKHLGHIGGRQLTAKDLANDFGLESRYISAYLNGIVAYVNSRMEAEPDYYALIENLWCSFVDVEKSGTLTSNKNYQNTRQTYALEFYISVIGKLLAANILSRKALKSAPEEIQDIISGRFFENSGIYNFAEYDYFGWLSGSGIADITSLLSGIQSDLAVYDYENVNDEDLFGCILVQFANRHHRLLLGQELTPSWLSDMIVRHAISMLPEGEMPRFVDMCCGSGSMLTATLNATKNLAKNLSPQDYRSALMSCCTGFDIDPLATILAKINWLVNIAGEIDFSEGIYIPIYHSDSLFVSSLASYSSSGNRTVTLYDRTLNVPEILFTLKNQQLFDSIVNKCHDLLDVEAEREDFSGFIRDSIQYNNLTDAQIEETEQFAFDLYSAMYSLNKENKNGLWSFVIKNSLRPELIKSNFNGIVSNTPWLAMSKIANNPFRTGLKKLAETLNIMPTGSSSHHIEMATIFLVSSVSRYLCDDGVFGCILPHSVLNGNHHEKFRCGSFSTATDPVSLDFSEILLLPDNVFKNKSIALFGRKRDFIQRNEIDGKTIDENGVSETLFRVKASGNMTIWTNETLTLERHDFDFYNFRQGADIMPRSLFFFNLTKINDSYTVRRIGPGTDYAYFLKDMKTAKDFSVPEVTIAASHFFPVLLSHVLTPFHISEMPLSLLPIHKDKQGKWAALSETEIKFLPRPVQHAFESISRRYETLRPGKQMYATSLNMRNKLSAQILPGKGYLVVYGAGGSHTCAAYMGLDGQNNNFIIDQTIYYDTVSTEDEAIYLAGMLNSNTLSLSISAFQSQGALGKRHIHTLATSSIPPFNVSNPKHIKFTDTTRRLMNELLSATENCLTDPNSDSVSVRRSRIYRIMGSLPSFELYERTAAEILTEDNGGQGSDTKGGG